MQCYLSKLTMHKTVIGSLRHKEARCTWGKKRAIFGLGYPRGDMGVGFWLYLEKV